MAAGASRPQSCAHEASGETVEVDGAFPGHARSLNTHARRLRVSAVIATLSPPAVLELEAFVAQVVATQLAEMAPKQSGLELLTIREAADVLRTTPAAIYKRLQRGQLTAVRPEGSQILLRKEDLLPSGPRRPSVL
jgi:excisionase family DNA binding protein